MYERLNKYFSLVKFSHTLFALPFALLAFFMAIHTQNSGVNMGQLGAVLVCMITARNAAMAFNRYIDADIDKENPRTSLREIPAGLIKATHAALFVTINIGVFIVATWYINSLCLALAPVALAVILGYSYTKRFTYLCHFVLGMGLAMAPLGAYIAVTAQFAIAPLLLAMVVLCWVAGFDIIYALQDVAFDRAHHLNSLPARFGKSSALNVSRVLHILAAAVLVYFGIYANMQWMFWCGATIFLAMLVYQHSILNLSDLSNINIAFFTSNGIASVVLGCCAIIDFMWLRH